MALRVLVNKRRIWNDGMRATLNVKSNRISLNRNCVDILQEKFGGEVWYLGALVDSEIKDTVWLKPTGDSEKEGSYKVTKPKTSIYTRSVRLPGLSKALELKTNSCIGVGNWDTENQALKIVIKDNLEIY